MDDLTYHVARYNEAIEAESEANARLRDALRDLRIAEACARTAASNRRERFDQLMAVADPSRSSPVYNTADGCSDRAFSRDVFIQNMNWEELTD